MLYSCRRMHEELKSAGGSVRLASQVASCISKALQLLAEKAEYMAATGMARLLCHQQGPFHIAGRLLTWHDTHISPAALLHGLCF